MITIKSVSSKVDTFDTCLYGHVHISYEHLVKVFGKPTSQRPSGDNKVRIRWDIKFSDNSVATIYDWKNYKLKNKEIKEHNLDWNIGGVDESVVNKIAEVLKGQAMFYVEFA